jgi:hypothetical protein
MCMCVAHGCDATIVDEAGCEQAATHVEKRQSSNARTRSDSWQLLSRIAAVLQRSAGTAAVWVSHMASASVSERSRRWEAGAPQRAGGAGRKEERAVKRREGRAHSLQHLLQGTPANRVRHGSESYSHSRKTCRTRGGMDAVSVTRGGGVGVVGGPEEGRCDRACQV